METSLIWIYFFLTLALIMIILVPKEKILELLPFGFVGGFIIAAIVQYIAVDIFKFWRFNAALVSILNIPLGVLLAWIPPVIIFAYFWPKLDSGINQTIYILFFAFGTSIIEYGFVLAGDRSYLNWNVYLTFLLALVIHVGLGYYLANKEKIKGS